MKLFPSRLIAALGVLLAVAGCSPHGLEALRRGDEILSAGRAQEAIPWLERAVTDLPTHAVAWNHLGLAYQATRRIDEARKAYLRALEFDRNLFDVHFNLGALEFESSRWVDAERSLRTYLGVERNRTNLVAWRLLGETQLASKQLDLAERTFATALQLNPKDTALRHQLGLALGQKRRWREAQAQFAEVLKIRPDFSPAELNLAIAFQQLGDRRAALDHYKAYLNLNTSGSEVEAVRMQVRQLEGILNPPTVVSTNLVSSGSPATTNTLKPLQATNTLVPHRPKIDVISNNVANIRTPGRTKTPPTPTTNSEPVATKPIELTPKPEFIPPPPVEVVKVEEAPELKTAKDPLPDTPAEPARIPEPKSIPPQTNAMATVASTPPSTPTQESKTAELNRSGGFWQKVNPVTWGKQVTKANPLGWFRGKPSEAATNNLTPTQLESSTNPTVAVAPKSKTKPSNPAPIISSAALPTANTPPAGSTPAPRITPLPSPTPQKPKVARYPAWTPPVLKAGNRDAAVAASRNPNDPLGSWQKAVQLDPTWAEAWHQYGRLAVQSKLPSLALSAGEAVITLEPNSATSHQLFAAALAQANYPADAAEQLERAVALSPGNTATHLALAGIYARDLGEPEKARPHYQQVLTLDPQHPQADAIRIWLAKNP